MEVTLPSGAVLFALPRFPRPTTAKLKRLAGDPHRAACRNRREPRLQRLLASDDLISADDGAPADMRIAFLECLIMLRDVLPNERLAAGLQRPRNLYMPLAYGHINRVVQNRLRHADIAMMFEQPIHIFRAPQTIYPYQHCLKLDSIHTHSLTKPNLIHRAA